MINAAKMQDRYKTGVSGAGQAFADGVSNTTKDPIELAKASEGKWGQKVQEAVANGSFVKGLSKTNKGIWQANAKAAQSKYTGSAALGSMKYGMYAAKAAPVLADIQREVQSMPDVTPADADARMLRNAQLARERLKSL